MKHLYLTPLLGLLAAGFFASCDVLEPDLGARLVDARARWTQQGIVDYDMDFQRAPCECLPESVLPVRITVEQGAVVSAVDRTNGSAIPNENLHYYLTVTEMFVHVEWAISQHAYRIDVTYDPQYGFPTTVSIDMDPQMVDDEMEFTMGNFTPR